MFRYFIRLLPVALTVASIQSCLGYDSRINQDELARMVAESSLGDLESRSKTIVAELDRLARFSMNSGVGRIGFRSNTHESPNETEWVQIDFEGLVAIDKVVLVPTLWRDAELGFVAEAFPQAFEIIVGAGVDDPGTVVARINQENSILPRMAPFIVDFESIEAGWLKIIATRLTPRKFDGLFALQFSEVLVYDGPKNIALGKTVTTSSAANAGAGAWNEKFLVDGFLPYLMDSADGVGSLSFVNDATLTLDQLSYTIDLGEEYQVDQLLLHVVEQTDTVPQAFPGDFGVPYEFVLEGSNDRDFSNPVTLLDYERTGVLDAGPIICLNLKSHLCRYLRLTALRPYVFDGYNNEGEHVVGSRLGFAELEILTNGRNVALGKRVDPGIDIPLNVRRIEALTDGSNLYGKILGIREWMDQLAKRHDLLVELPLVSAQLQNGYARQKFLLQTSILSLVGFVILTFVLILVARTRQQKAIFRTRERITADLHDVLGGNISAMVLLSELAQDQNSDTGKRDGYIERIDTLAKRTRNALKYVSDMLSQSGLYENLFAEMRRIATGLTEGLQHDLRLSGDEFVSRINQKNRVDIFLFYKECLVNVIRHSHATRILTSLSIDERNLELSVCDNGIGLGNTSPVNVPDSLRRRARILGARVTTSKGQLGGCCIRLVFKWNRSRFMRMLDHVTSLPQPLIHGDLDE